MISNSLGLCWMLSPCSVLCIVETSNSIVVLVLAKEAGIKPLGESSAIHQAETPSVEA